MLFPPNPPSPLQAVKQQITDREGIPAGEQRLVFAGKELQDGTTLSTYDKLTTNATLFLVLPGEDIAAAV